MLGLKQSMEGLEEAPRSSAVLLLESWVNHSLFRTAPLPGAILAVILSSWSGREQRSIRGRWVAPRKCILSAAGDSPS